MSLLTLGLLAALLAGCTLTLLAGDAEPPKAAPAPTVSVEPKPAPAPFEDLILVGTVRQEEVKYQTPDGEKAIGLFVLMDAQNTKTVLPTPRPVKAGEAPALRYEDYVGKAVQVAAKGLKLAKKAKDGSATTLVLLKSVEKIELAPEPAAPAPAQP